MAQATGPSTEPSLEKRILVFEEFPDFKGICNDLERGGLHLRHIITASDYSEGLAITINSLYNIVGALFHCCLEKKACEVRQLHSALKKKNSDVEIYLVGGPSCDKSLIDSGIVTLHINGFLPLQFGGPAEENYLCQLGRMLQQKYFTLNEEAVPS